MPFELDSLPQIQGVSDIHFMPDGRIVVSGRLRLPQDDFTRVGVRLFSDGSIDPSFTNLPALGGRITPWNNKFYALAGQGVYRSDAEWVYDPSFDQFASYPMASVFQGGDYHVYPDGSVLASGGIDLNDPARGYVGYYRLVWFTNTGWLDTTRTHRQANGDILAFRALHPEAACGSVRVYGARPRLRWAGGGTGVPHLR
ncbi:MAG: delta-60 repeat domain-containing protein [Flavobacteriales bacterium]